MNKWRLVQRWLQVTTAHRVGARGNGAIISLPLSQRLAMMPTRNVSGGGGMPNNKVKYSRLADSDDGYIDLQVSLSSRLLLQITMMGVISADMIFILFLFLY